MSKETEISFEDLVLLNNQSLGEGDMPIDFSLEQLKDSKVGDNADSDAGNVDEEEKTKQKELEDKTKEDADKAAKLVEEESVKKAEAEKTKKDAVKTTDNFSGIVKKLLETGDWKDAIIEKDGVDTKLSEMEELDPETFLSVWEEQKKANKEESDKNNIEITGLDENNVRLINIIKSGGDLREIFKDESQLVRPFENSDLEDLQTQQNIVFQQFLRQGISKEDATDLVVKATKDLTVGDKAKNITVYYQKNYDDNLKDIEKQTIADRVKEQEEIKEYKKTLSSLFKEDGTGDAVAKPLIEAATKYDKSGNLHIDTVYESIMKDPKQAKDLIFFMLEKEKFLTANGATIRRATNLDTMRRIKLVQETAKVTSPAKEKEKEVAGFGSIVLGE